MFHGQFIALQLGPYRLSTARQISAHVSLRVWASSLVGIASAASQLCLLLHKPHEL